MLGTSRTSARERVQIPGVGQFTTSGGWMDPSMAPAKKGDDEYRTPTRRRVKPVVTPQRRRNNRPHR